MRKSLTFPFLTENHAMYLPDNLNFWTLATVALGSAFLFLVIITIVIIYRTEPEPVLPVRANPTVNHIEPPENEPEVQVMMHNPCSATLNKDEVGGVFSSSSLMTHPEMLVSPELLLDRTHHGVLSPK